MSLVVTKPVAFFGIATLLAASSTWYLTSTTTTTTSTVAAAPFSPLAISAATLPTYPPPPPEDFKVILLRAGLSPEALAAAGVQPAQVSAAFQTASQVLTSTPNLMHDADAAFAEARANTDRLKRKIQSGKAEEGDVQAYQAAKTALATATTAREAVLNQVFDAATASLGDTRRQALQAIRTNRAAWNLPTEFLVVNRSEQEWVQLRDFLANERIAPKVGEEPDPSAQAALANWRANASVAAARTGLTSNLDSMRSSWNQATGD